MTLRITGGAARGRKLFTPRGMRLRPSASRLREAIFDVVGTAVYGRTVLDLYAGIGALGIEALSRGAGSALFVEEDPVAAELIRRNLELLPEAQGSVLIGKVERRLGTTLRNARRFSLVFLDPPYRYGWVEKTLLLLEKNRVAAPGALIVAEHESRLALPLKLAGWSFIKTKVFGDSAFSLWNLTSNEE